MSFTEHIPEYVRQLESERGRLLSDRASINWGHECDCEFCDRDGEDPDDNAEERYAEIETELKEVTDIIDKLTGKKASLLNLSAE